MTLICYCIQNSNMNKTYIGATNDFSRRIRQHNGIISGGATSDSFYDLNGIGNIVISRILAVFLEGLKC